MQGFYLRMRLRQFLRFFSFNQVNPVAGIIILLGLFLFISEIIFLRVSYAGVVYVALAFYSLVQIQSAGSNAYLLQSVGRNTFFQLKLRENLVIIIPFLSDLLVHRYYGEAAGLLLAAIPYSRYSFSMPRPKLKALRTPYLRHSFEFQSGFRTYWIVYPLHLLLLVAAVLSANVYVLLVAYFFLLFFISTFYGRVEEEPFIWMYRVRASKFLAMKLGAMAKQYSISFSVFFIVGAIFFTPEVPLLLLCLVVGMLGLAGCLLIKYHFYPSEFFIQVSQMIFLGVALFCIFSPPYVLLLLAVLLFSFTRARNKLKTILQC